MMGKIRGFIHPMDGMRRYGGKLSWGTAIVDVIIAGVILGFSVGIGGLLLSLVGMSMGPLKALSYWIGAGAGIVAGLVILVGAIIIIPIVYLIGWIVASAFIWIIAKPVGGKASFSEQTINLGSLVIAPMMLLSALVAWIPLIGGILIFLIELYALYPLTIVLRETHKFSTGRALISWIVGGILLYAVWLALMAVFAFTFISAL